MAQQTNAPQPTAENMMMIAAQAAQAAASAAQALQDFASAKAAPKEQRFAEAGKVIKIPEPFGSEDHESDQRAWRDFYLNFKSWLFYADEAFEPELTYVEKNPKTVIALSGMTAGPKARSLQLYSILTGLLRGKPLRILRQVEERNGVEVLRQLIDLYVPSSRSRSIALLQAFLQFPAFTRDRTMLEQILALERLRNEYQTCSGKEVSDDLALSVLVKSLPQHVRQHIQLQMSETTTYADTRARILGYESTVTTWSTTRLHTELGVVGSYATGPNGPANMEIDALTYKGKGKGKSKDGKGKGKGKSKDGKGKSSWQNTTPKGKGKDAKGKSGGKSTPAKVDSNTCSYCFKPGHWKRDCRKLQADRAAGKVRQVRDDDVASTAAESGVSNVPTSAGVSTAAGPSSHAGVSNVRRIESLSTPIIEDLTAFDAYSAGSCSHVRALQHVGAFDMTYSDSDDCWTVAPYDSDVSQICTVGNGPCAGDLIEILLDTGADSSVLPLSFAHLGQSISGASSGHFVDAQGAPLGVQDVRMADVAFGEACFRERFIIAPVTGPILCVVKLLRAGWDFERDGDDLYLCKGAMSFPVHFKKNSMYSFGSISKITELCETSSSDSPLQVSAIRLTALKDLGEGWHNIATDVWALRSFSSTCIDTTLCPSPSLMWLRTVLVKYSFGWEVIEFAQPISELADRELAVPNRHAFEEMITIAHVHAVPSEFLGFEMDDSALPDEPMIGLGLDETASVEIENQNRGAPKSEPIEVENVVHGAPEMEPPMAAEGELAPQDRAVDAPDDGSIMVDGVKLTQDTPLRVIRTACEALGLSKKGSKKECMKRLQRQIATQEIFASHTAESRIRAEGSRDPVPQKRPIAPSPEQVAKHDLTHEPYEEWCEICVSHRGRQDRHPAADITHTEHSTVSFDFGFATRTATMEAEAGEASKVAFLACHDKHTGLIGAIPSPGKGGKHFTYLVTELTRFVVSTGHRELALRCDNEPATLAIFEACRKTCRSLGIKIHDETVPVGSHQSNGAAERVVELVRSHANMLVNQLERNCGSDKQIFGCLHPVYSWALAHGAWIHNRYRLAGGQTAYERATGRVYTGRLAQFGEKVLGYIKLAKKGDPRWLAGIWLGKSHSGDCHILVHEGVLFTTRSIRRLPETSCFDIQMLDFEVDPWTHGMASLGHRVMLTPRYTGPEPFSAPAIPDEAASDPPSDREQIETSVHSTYRKAATGVKHSHDPGADGEPMQKAPRVRFEDDNLQMPAQAGIPERSTSSSAGASAPPPPNAAPAGPAEVPMEGALIASRGPLELEASSRPSKSQRINALQEQHEDESIDFTFADAELDGLETYDADMDAELECAEEAELTITNAIQEHLTFPYDIHEPSLSDDAMKALDSLADQVEVERLQGMGVLTDAEELYEKHPNAKMLSTRFVRTWRDKWLGDKHVWLRRSRLVAREYAWIDQRTDLFSPASNAIGSRLLPALYLRNKHDGFLLGAIDIGDAFLTVTQREPTVVTAVDSLNKSTTFALGKVLPGQRAGSQWWYESITELLCSELDMRQCKSYPNLLSTPDHSCLILLHVDDMLICGKDTFIDGKLVPMLEKHHRISSAFIRQVGDEISFLKRTHRLVSPDKLTISTHPRHIEQLMKLTGVKPTSRPKKVPGHPLMDEFDETEELDALESSEYRSCVGILLYLASDLPHCQHCIRHLSTGMSKPTKRLKDVLRHLVSYLYGTKGVCLCLQHKGDNVGVHHAYLEDPDIMHLEVFSDADWASDKKTRRSISAGYICLGSCLLYSSSRTQRVIALSSAESEVYAACSAACDGVLIAQMLSFCTGLVVECHHLMDSSAGRGVLARQGVGRIRHLSCRVLWLQDLVKARSKRNLKGQSKNLESIHTVSGVSGSNNVADLGTKRLGKKRLEELMVFCNIGHLEDGQFVPITSETNLIDNTNMLSLIRALKMSPNVTHQCIAQLLLVSALSPGAAAYSIDMFSNDESWIFFSEISFAKLIFTVLFGFMCFIMVFFRYDVLIFCRRRCPCLKRRLGSMGEDDEAEASVATTSSPTGFDDQPYDYTAFGVEPSEATQSLGRFIRAGNHDPEHVAYWIYARCWARRERADTPERFAMYQERMALIRELVEALQNPPDAETRARAIWVMHHAGDLSHDEESPTHEAEDEAIHDAIRDCARAAQVGRAMNAGGSMVVDAVADELLRLADEMDEESTQTNDAMTDVP